MLFYNKKNGHSDMDKKLAEVIKDYDSVIIGIGSEWNWIQTGIKKDPRYAELLDYSRQEGNKWLRPILEFEYGYFHNNPEIDDAYRGLKKLIQNKDYFLVCDTFVQDAVMNGFDENLCVYPCGTYRFLQTSDPEDELLDVTVCDDFQGFVHRIHSIITDREGHLLPDENFYKPFHDGKSLYLNQKRQEYSNIKYNESAYLPNWDKYMKHLAGTMGKSLLVLELGVSLDYPTVIRWPFEKVAFVNDKARLIRVHEKLYHHTPEIENKTDSVPMNSVKFILQESEGL
jgi:hypothetical protein